MKVEAGDKEARKELARVRKLQAGVPPDTGSPGRAG